MYSVKIERKGLFLVEGIHVRTSNMDESDPSMARIPGLWQRFYAEGIIERVQNRLDDSVFAIYHDYESDQTGAYGLLLGCAVMTARGGHTGLVLTEVPAQRYAVVTSQKGQMPGIIVDAWRWVWSAKPEELGGRRAFLADFEVYDQRSADPANAEVEIWIGLED